MKSWLLLLSLFVSTMAQAETWRFGLIGDVPYSDYERQELPRMLEYMAGQNLEFIAHVGDIKAGKDRCDDAMYADRFQMFNASRVPFILVAGDNEWSDCERESNGAYDPLERLNKLRSLFWKDPWSLGQRKMGFEQSAGVYREHLRFRLGPVLFATLNLPGSDNNFGSPERPGAEFLARNPQVMAWMKANFAVARQEKLGGIVLLFQADPSFKHFNQGLAHRGFIDFLNLLREETLAFPGQVVVVHGDSHISRIDHPLRDKKGKTIPHFTRVETHGYPIMGWTNGIIDTENPALFRFEAHNWPEKAQ